MKIWDTGEVSGTPNNCVMINVMVYNDGWIVAWLQKESMTLGVTGGTTFVDAQTLGGFGTFIEYMEQYNGCILEVESSTPTDPECPDGAVFSINRADFAAQTMKVHPDGSDNAYHFNTGHTYQVGIYQSNGELVWWGHYSRAYAPPPNMSNRLYRAIYEMWEVLEPSSNATDESLNPITKAYYYDHPVYTDETIDFNDDGVDDFYLLPSPEDVNDAFYYGHDKQFSGVTLDISQAAVGNTVVWEYWNGTSWATLTVVDGTAGFTISGVNDVTFAPPGDWAETDVNSDTMYWVRSRCSVASFTTHPIGTQGWVLSRPYHVVYTDTNLGMYSFEDTAAKYCLICGANDTYNGTSTNFSNEYFYATSLPTKIVYSHAINYSGGDRDDYGSYSNRHRCWFSVNGYLLDFIENDNTDGFMSINVEPYDTGSGAQNTYHIKLSSSYTSSRAAHGNLAVVMITS